MSLRKHKPTPVVNTTNVSPTIAVINQSSVLSDAQLTPVIAALQIQCDRDFAPLWGVTGKLVQVLKGQTALQNAWQLVVLDDSDQAGALGYHDFTPQGKPVAFIFAKTDQQYNAKVSVTMSHELLEMLADAGCDLCAQSGDTTFMAYEACDAVEDDSLGYDINGITVSDFVTPAYFMQTPPTNAKLDFKGVLHAPFTLAAGGYANVWDPQNGWTQAFNGQVQTPTRVQQR